MTRTDTWVSTTEPTCPDTIWYPRRDWRSTTSYPSYISYTYTERKRESKDERKERLKQENITHQISLYSEYIKQIQVKSIRSSIQLRGVSFSGRGWA